MQTFLAPPCVGRLFAVSSAGAGFMLKCAAGAGFMLKCGPLPPHPNPHVNPPTCRGAPGETNVHFILYMHMCMYMYIHVATSMH
jgi:hypothetical protein